jgi:hypothetical protein
MNRPVTVASVMFAVHAMFRREFGQMSHLVRAVAAGDTQRATLVTDHIALVSGVMSSIWLSRRNASSRSSRSTSAGPSTRSR